MLSLNNWTPAMFACRYGNLELLKYFVDNSCIIDGFSPYTLIHAACFGNEIEVLHYLIDELKKSVTPLTYEQTPLKQCFKYENKKLIEFLIS
jgi:ankyrin repeat protein